MKEIGDVNLSSSQPRSQQAPTPNHAIALPEDVVLMIFQLACHNHGMKRVPPTVLSHICRPWRIVAIGSAMLWSKLVFILPDPGQTPAHRFSMQEEWIERSLEAPLDVEIKEKRKTRNGVDSSGSPSSSHAGIDRILALLLPHSKRWRSLNIELSHSKPARYVCGQLERIDVPILESFTVNYGGGSAEDSGSVFPFQTGTPTLSKITMRSAEWNILYFHPTFTHRLSNVQVLRVVQSSFGTKLKEAIIEIVDLIRRSPRLSSLTVEGFRYREPDTDPRNDQPQEVVAPCLIEFEIEHEQSFSALLPYIRLPALQALFLPVRPYQLRLIHQFNPFPNLRYLVIQGLYHEEWSQPVSTLPPLLSHLEALESLRILWFKSSSDLVDKEWPRLLSDICPNLTKLEVDWRLGVSEGSVKALVGDRVAQGHPLHTLMLRNAIPSVRSDSWIKWLGENVESVVIE